MFLYPINMDVKYIRFRYIICGSKGRDIKYGSSEDLL